MTDNKTLKIKQKTIEKNRPKNGSVITVDPIRNPKDIQTIKKLIYDKPRDYFLFVFGINTGLRISDILYLKVCALWELEIGDNLQIRESKTKKLNIIRINKPIKKAFDYFVKETRPRINDYIFKSRKGNKPLSMAYVNYLIKAWTSQINLKSGNFGARTLRKTWGYQQRKAFGTPIELISKRYNHASPAVTMRYIGIQKEEIEEILDNEI